MQDALAQTLAEQQQEDGDGDALGGRGGALGDDSEAEDMDDDDGEPASRAGSGLTASTSVRWFPFLRLLPFG